MPPNVFSFSRSLKPKQFMYSAQCAQLFCLEKMMTFPAFHTGHNHSCTVAGGSIMVTDLEDFLVVFRRVQPPVSHYVLHQLLIILCVTRETQTVTQGNTALHLRRFNKIPVEKTLLYVTSPAAQVHCFPLVSVFICCQTTVGKQTRLL